jgi:hypothetical protein
MLGLNAYIDSSVKVISIALAGTESVVSSSTKESRALFIAKGYGTA